MFYLAMNLRTSLTFLHYEMDKLANKDFIIDRLKDKVQGKCYRQYGYVVQIPNFNKNGDDSTLFLQNPIIEEHYCQIIVRFNAICFKVMKNDIMSTKIIEVQEDHVIGRSGPIIIKIPKIKIDQSFQYNKIEHCFYSSENRKKIEVGSRVVVSVFEVYVQMNCEMKVIGSILISKLVDLIQ